MEQRLLGSTGLMVSAIGVGTWQLSGPLAIDGKPDGFPDPGKDEVVRLIQACGDLGINVVDTAEMYGDGEGERRIGEAVRSCRDRWTIASKFGMSRGSAGERQRRTDADSVVRSVEGSLRRLGTDRIDVYMYHSPPAPEHVHAGVELLARLKSQGKIRFSGISSNDPKIVKRLAGLGGVDVVMFSQSMLTHPARMMRLIAGKSLGGMVRGVFEGGRLSGRYFCGTPRFAADDIRSTQTSGEDFGRFASYEELVPEGWSMADFALRYVLDHPTTHTAVLGGRSIDCYRQASRALQMPPLGARLHKQVNDLRPRLGGRTDSANRGVRTIRAMVKALIGKGA